MKEPDRVYRVRLSGHREPRAGDVTAVFDIVRVEDRFDNFVKTRREHVEIVMKAIREGDH